MPNWCDNRMTVSGPTEIVEEFATVIMDDKNEVSLLERFLPFPPALHGDEIELKNGEKMRVFSERGYSWCLANWGCKWPESGATIVGEFDTDDEKFLTIYFTTPWGPPDVGVQRISAIYPELTFAIAYHEDGMGFAGGVQYSGGEMISELDVSEIPEYDENDEDKWTREIDDMYEDIFEQLSS